MTEEEKQQYNSVQGKPEKKACLLLPIIVATVIFVTMVVAIVVSACYQETILLDEENKDYYCYQIDCVEVVDDKLTISGWFFEREKSTVELGERDYFPEICVVLRLDDSEYSDVCYLDTVSRLPREDVNEYFLCDYDYTNCGFVASMDISEMALPNDNYEILILLDKNGDKAISTSEYVNDLQLAFYNKSVVPEPDVYGTDLQTVVDNGYFRAYNKGIYIYQMDWRIYLFADDTFNFSEDGNTEIHYISYTTQYELLPQEMLDRNWPYCDVIETFENIEITGTMNAGKYRVAVLEIPTEYSVRAITIGQVDNDWLWKEAFIPRYEY